MQEATFAVNPNASQKVDFVGCSGTPVIVIDDFGIDPGEVIDYACGPAEYGPDTTSMYPGLRANMPRDFVREVLKNVYKLLFSAYNVPPELGLKAVRAAYSLITTPEQVVEKDVKAYMQSSKKHAAANGPPEQAYVKGSNDEYELYHRIEYRQADGQYLRGFLSFG